MPALDEGVSRRSRLGRSDHAYGDLWPSFRHHHGDPRVTVIDGMAGAGVIWGLLAGQMISGLVDPVLETPGDRRLRDTAEVTRFPYLGFLATGVKLVARMLFGRAYGAIMKAMRQVLIYRGKDGFWIAECPSLPGCVTQGETQDAALANIREAIAAFVGALEAPDHKALDRGTLRSILRSAGIAPERFRGLI